MPFARPYACEALTHMLIPPHTVRDQTQTGLIKQDSSHAQATPDHRSAFPSSSIAAVICMRCQGAVAAL